MNYSMSDRIDEIYKILITYIQQDNEDKNKMKEKLANIENTLQSVEVQTIKTNGRVTKSEGDILILQGNDNRRATIYKINWAWLSAIGGIAMIILTFVIDLLKDFISNKFFK